MYLHKSDKMSLFGVGVGLLSIGAFGGVGFCIFVSRAMTNVCTIGLCI